MFFSTRVLHLTQTVSGTLPASYLEVNVKVKCEVHPRTGHEAPEGEYRYRSIFSLTSALNGDGWSKLYPRERPSPHCTGGWVGSEPVWTSAEILAPTGIRSTHRPARSESLYRLHYPGLPYPEVLWLNWGYTNQDFKLNLYSHHALGIIYGALPTFIHMSSCHGAN